MGPKSMARAARWADGVAGFDLAADPAGIAAGFRHFEAAWADAGRAGTPFRQTSFWFGLDADAPARVHDYAYRYLRIFGDDGRVRAGRTARARRRRARSGTASTALADAGCDEAILVATTADLDELARVTELVAGLGDL